MYWPNLYNSPNYNYFAINALINIVTDVFFSDWHGLFGISAIKRFILPKRSHVYQKCSKNGLQKGNFCRHILKTPKHTQQREVKWRYTICKMLCFTFIVELIAVCPFCLYGSAVKIVFCHVHIINSPIAMCVNFGLQIPPLQAEKCQFTTYTKSFFFITL